MKQIDPAQAKTTIQKTSALSVDEICVLQAKRLHELVGYARDNSPYLSEKYKDLPEDFSLSDIPVSTRTEMTTHFDQWVCDPQITKNSIEDYLAERGNLFKQYLGKYSIATTSGTTAEPLRIVRDAHHLAIHGALMSERYFHGSLLKDVGGIEKPFLKSCAIIPDTGFHSSYLSFLRTRKFYEEKGMADRTLLISVFAPTHEMVAALNDFQPEMIGCYPSTILILAYEQMAGRLNIHPLYIGCSAEKLTEKNRSIISKAFGCPVNNNYCSTEGGEVAMLCKNGHLHVNSDWIILEPVDKNLSPVPDGEPSEGVLITNLANFAQPVIRYHMTDNVVLHSNPCGCSLPLPYIEINGRMEDVLEFSQDDKIARIAGTTLFIAAIDTDGCETAQFIQRSPNDLEIRILTLSGYDPGAVKARLFDAIKDFLNKSGLTGVRIEISDDPPIRSKGGKIRAAYKDF